MKLNIYWCTDERYFYQTSISVFSLLLHKREEDKAHLNILSYKPLKEKNRQVLKKAVSSFPGATVTYRLLESELSGKLVGNQTGENRLTSTTYARATYSSDGIRMKESFTWIPIPLSARI